MKTDRRSFLQIYDWEEVDNTAKQKVLLISLPTDGGMTIKIIRAGDNCQPMTEGMYIIDSILYRYRYL